MPLSNPPLSALRHAVIGELNPVLVKELRQELRVRSFVHSFVWFHLAMIILTIMSPALRGADAEFSISSALFWSVLAVPLLLVIPMRAFTVFSKETRANELELIFLTRISAWQMVFYKWVALCLEGVLLLVAALPYAITRYFLGSMNMIDALYTLGVFLLLMFLLSALAVMISAGNAERRRISGFFAILGLLVLYPVINGVFAIGYTGYTRLGGGGSVTSFETVVLWLIYIPLFLVLLLEFAASRIAPRAENHARVKRLLGLLAIVVGFVLVTFDIKEELVATTVLAYLLPICVGALCEKPTYILSIYAPFVRGAWWKRPIGALLYPGWASGILYTTFICAVLFLLVLLQDLVAPAQAIFGLVLLAGGMFLPLVVANACWPRQRGRLVFYLMTQGLVVGFSALVMQVVGRHACSGWDAATATDIVISFFPLSVFMLQDSRLFCPVYPVLACSLLTIFLLLGIQWWREWHQVRHTQAQARTVLGGSTPHA